MANLFDDQIELDFSEMFLVKLEGGKLPAGFDGTAAPPAATQDGVLDVIIAAARSEGVTILEVNEQMLPALAALAPFLPRNPVFLVGLEDEPISRAYSATARSFGSITINDLLAAIESGKRVDKEATRTRKSGTWRRGSARSETAEVAKDNVQDIDDSGDGE